MGGEAGYVMHNMNTMVTRAPCCGVRMFKEDGCNHMTCRCGAEWCWLCRRVVRKAGDDSAEYYKHWEGMQYFGCSGGMMLG